MSAFGLVWPLVDDEQILSRCNSSTFVFGDEMAGVDSEKLDTAIQMGVHRSTDTGKTKISHRLGNRKTLCHSVSDSLLGVLHDLFLMGLPIKTGCLRMAEWRNWHTQGI